MQVDAQGRSQAPLGAAEEQGLEGVVQVVGRAACRDFCYGRKVW